MRKGIRSKEELKQLVNKMANEESVKRDALLPEIEILEHNEDAERHQDCRIKPKWVGPGCVTCERESQTGLIRRIWVMPEVVECAPDALRVHLIGLIEEQCRIADAIASIVRRSRNEDEFAAEPTAPDESKVRLRLPVR